MVESDGVKHFYFQGEVCQLRLDGCNGSNDCTMIAVNVCMNILDGSFAFATVGQFVTTDRDNICPLYEGRQLSV